MLTSADDPFAGGLDAIVAGELLREDGCLLLGNETAGEVASAAAECTGPAGDVAIFNVGSTVDVVHPG